VKRALLMVLVMACRSSTPDEAPATCTGTACAPVGVLKEHCLDGFVYNDDVCEPVLPATDCKPGTMPIIGKTECQPVGVSKCAEGFESDGAGGCNVILPPTRCPIGKMALPGETTCTPVAPCGTGPWGDIPTDASTVYVDGAFTGASDGSRDKPFTTVQAGIDAGTDVVAIAAGKYLESVRITKKLRVIGVCPDLVDLQPTSGPGITVETSAAGTTISKLGVVAVGNGIKVVAASMTLDRVRIHGTGDIGLVVQGPKSVTVTASRLLIEGATAAGIGLGTANLVLSDSIVRDTQSGAGKTGGRGIQVQAKAVLTMKRSIVERNRDSGIFLSGAEATIDGSVVRDTMAVEKDKMFGRGISARGDVVGKTPSKLTLRGSIVERNHSAGVWISGSQVSVSDTVIRDTLNALADGKEGSGLDLSVDSETMARSTGTLTSSLIAKNHDGGIVAFGSDLTVKSTIVRDTEARDFDKRFGTGIHAQLDPDIKSKAVLKIDSSLITHNRYDGLSLIGSDATLENTVISETLPAANNNGLGRGMSVQDDDATAVRSVLILRKTVVERNRESGIAVFGSDATIEGCVIRDTAPQVDNLFGLGIGGDVNPKTSGRASITIRGSLIARSHEGGILAFGSDVTVEHTAVIDTFAQPGDGLFGDGIAAMDNRGFSASLKIVSCTVRGSARAAVAAFGSALTLSSSKLTCGAFDLNLEPGELGPANVTDGGKNFCGCGGTYAACKGTTSNLAPAQPPASGP
jgi:hypothetical protein